MTEKSKENGGGMETDMNKDDKPKVIKKLSSKDGKPIGTYTKAELMNLSESPVSRKKHACLADEFCDKNGVWDPERWHASFSNKSSRGSSPIGFEGKEIKKKTLDPKERLKEEQRDGIVLSPQRRSFVHGCQVNTTSSDNSGSNQSNNTYDSRDGHDRPPVRRIGSGRIIPRASPSDYQDKDRGRGRDSRDYRYESRGRYDRDKRTYKNSREDAEPEWFTGGPTSQTDTIELRGFQDANSSRNSAEEKKKKPEKVKNKKVEQNGTGKQEARISPAPEEPKEEKKPETSGGTKEFDINQFFTLADSIENISVPSQDTVGSGSRFSQWFSSNSTKSVSPVQEKQMGFLSELQGRHSPNLSASLFMPIKPDRETGPQSTSDILAMLQRSNMGPQRSNNSVQRFMEQHQGGRQNRSPTPPLPGKITSVSELESQVRSLAEIEGELYNSHSHHNRSQHQLHFGEQPPHQMIPEQTAFNSFLANMQIKRGAVQRSHLINEEKRSPSPIDLVLGMGVKRQSPLPWKDQGMGNLHHHHIQQNQMHQMNTSLQQLLQNSQANQQQSIMNQHQSFTGSRIGHNYNTLQPPRPATRTPSPANADALSVAAMLKQMNNQQSQEQHMHVMGQSLATDQQLAAIMKQPTLSADVAALAILQQQQKQQKEVFGGSSAPAGRALSPQEQVLQQVLYQQAAAVARGPSPANIGNAMQAAPLSTTPIKQVQLQGSQMNMLTPGVMQPSPNMNRIPSPQELAAHTQNILHNAVIKRQLEVQKEKFLAREAARKAPAGTPDRQPVRPPVTPAFTPTSVIRKMYETKAEAKNEDQHHDREENESNRSVKLDLGKKLESACDEQEHNRQEVAMSQPHPNDMQRAFDVSFSSPTRKLHNEPQHHHQQNYQSPSPVNNLDMSTNQRPTPMQRSPGSHQSQNPSGNYDGINYKKILEIQRQQQQKAALAAVAGQSQQPSSQGQGMSSGHSMARPMHHGFPIQMMQRAPLMHGIHPVPQPHGMQVPNTFQQMQRGLHPGGVGGLSPMMMNTRAAFPGAAVVQAGLVHNQTTPLGARREFNLANQPVKFASETPTRASPVNLAKWFGNDLLQHPMPQMPQHNVLGQRVISVEELERQQQAVG
ncbi:eukaryotic translation initiation factor 4E transporter-like isoform X2 [Anneissia japonica]|nr:eukaryotic translation initiation factor 4E transporter-like isoform X2 [Anneissia japonica]